MPQLPSKLLSRVPLSCASIWPSTTEIALIYQDARILGGVQVDHVVDIVLAEPSDVAELNDHAELLDMVDPTDFLMGPVFTASSADLRALAKAFAEAADAVDAAASNGQAAA